MGRVTRTVERAAFTVGTALVASGAALGITDPHNQTAEVMVGTGTAATIAVVAAGAIQYANRVSRERAYAEWAAHDEAHERLTEREPVNV